MKSSRSCHSTNGHLKLHINKDHHGQILATFSRGSEVVDTPIYLVEHQLNQEKPMLINDDDEKIQEYANRARSLEIVYYGTNFEKGITVSMEEEFKMKILHYMQTLPTDYDSEYICMSFANYMLNVPSNNEHSIHQFHANWWKPVDWDEADPKLVMLYDENNKPIHAAICIARDLYIGIHGNSAPIIFNSFDQLLRIYPKTRRISKYTYIGPTALSDED